MDAETFQQKQPAIPEFLAGGGELGQMIRNYEWSNTTLGTVDTWPQSLRTCIRIMLTSRQPIWIGWGKELIKFYNDPYKAIVGGKHPWALGTPASIVWKDIWRDIEPMLRQVMEDDQGTYAESQLLIMERNGYPEETYYTFSYTPIPGDDGDTAGMICANTDDTDRIISERQLTTLTKLGSRLAETKTNEEVIAETIRTLSENSHDFPFAVFYIQEENKGAGSPAVLASSGLDLFPKEIETDDSTKLAQLFKEAAISRKLQILDDLKTRLGIMPKGAWEVSPDKAIILPVGQLSQKDPYGYLIIGCNPYRILDEKYGSFFSLIADQIANSFATVHALEEERKRAEALAEIDKAKTTFFSNISHEFRTPLTLLLGPIEDTLNNPEIADKHKDTIQLAHRNALRMQKLVNTLLDFSRIEAGRMDGKFTRVAIAPFTEDLASTFRSAIEKAGMELHINKRKIVDDVYVDIDMWEKIILNLISNAFKYSNKGFIQVDISQVGDNIQVSVSDTGIGIPADQVEKIFSRFHRVENTEGRSQEGTGIGLAMVKELVKFHSGSIDVTSSPGKGSVFTITIPVGRDHIPADKINDSVSNPALSGHSSAFVQEAMKWLPLEERNVVVTTEKDLENPEKTDVANKSKIILADDNADMRDYVERLLSEQFTVISAVNGEDAFDKMVRFKPDLLLSDIMMPKVDGFELLKRVRANPEIKNTPVIFLSARAGEEAKVEGLDAGADDYLVKPFSAKELLVRVTNHIRINQVRRETEQQFYQLFLQAPALINVLKGPEHTYEFYHPKNKELLGNKDFTGLTVREALPELEGQGIFEMLDEVYQTGKAITLKERHINFINDQGHLVEHYLNIIYQPWYDIRGRVQGILNFALDVTDAVLSRKKIEDSEKRFRTLILQAPVSIVVLMGRDFIVDIVNDNYLELVNRSRDKFEGRSLWEGLPEVKSQVFYNLLHEVMDTGTPYNGIEQEAQLFRNGELETIYINFIYSPLKDVTDQPVGIMVIATEVTQQVIARRKIEESEQALRELANAMPQLVWVSEPSGEVSYFNDRIQEFTGAIQLANGKWNWENLIHPDDVKETMRRWYESTHSNMEFVQEQRMQMNDGTYRWHLSRSIPQKDKDGNITKWFGTATDIHLAKEQAVILEEEVKRRTLELSEMNVSLQNSNDALQQFAHVASHDLKEPVRKIKTFSSMLEDEFSGQLPDKGKVYLQKVQNATQRMTAMIDGVLNYSTLNESEEAVIPVDLNETFNHIVNDLEVPIQQKKAIISWNNLPVVSGAPVLLHQLFYNILNNSLKFAKSGVAPEIIITGALRQENNGSLAEIVITDNGIGFSAENAEKIFHTFTRLHSKDKYEGTGLGLALCKKIVERYGGTIYAESEKGKGSTFTIILPLK